MKRSIFKTTLFILLLSVSLFSSCLKDSITRTYSVYEPIYISKAVAVNNIKANAPTPVEKPGKIYVLGNYIFLNEVDKGVHVIDNSDPAQPLNKYFIPIPGNIDIAVKGGILYADMFTDLIAVDISNPANIQVKKVIEHVFPARVYNNGFVGDSNRIITGWVKKDTTINVSTSNNYYLFAQNTVSSAGQNAATIPTGIAGSMARFSLVNNFLYAVTDRELNVIDVSLPANPIFSNMVQVGWRIETIYPFQDKLFIGSQTGMFIYSLADPAHPSYISQFTHLTACDPVIASDSVAYVTLRTGRTCAGTLNQLDILNVQNVQTPFLIKSYPLTNPQGLSKSGNSLFICDGNGGLKVFNASDPNNLQLLQTISGIDAYDIITIGNTAIVVATDGLYQYNFANTSNLVLLSKIGI